MRRHRSLADRGFHTEHLSQGFDSGVVVVGRYRHAVFADQLLQLVRRSRDDDLAVVDDRDPVAVLRLVHVVRRHEDRDVFLATKLADVAPDVLARLRIEADRRFVQEENPGRMEQAARDLKPPLHPAGERAHQAVTPFP